MTRSICQKHMFVIKVVICIQIEVKARNNLDVSKSIAKNIREHPRLTVYGCDNET